MKVTFIRPNMYEGRSHDAMEPLCFSILKSLTTNDVVTDLYDERIEEVNFDSATDLAALTVETYTAQRAYQIAAEYRKRGVPVVMGGYHPTLLPDEALQHADSVVIGDAERIWHLLIDDMRRGQLQRRYVGDNSAPLEGIDPDRSIFVGKRYAPMALVQYGRGCPFNCEFCSIKSFYGNQLRQRPVADIVREIEAQNRRHVFIVDDNLFSDLDRARQLFQALIPLNILWSCQVSIDVARYPDLLELMARSGCISALVGFESLDPQNLKQMKKSWNTKWIGYESAIKRLQDHGIMIYGTFVFGYDHDTVESLDQAVDFAIEHKFLLANFNPLTPMPGSRLYDRLLEENRLIYPHWWIDPRFRYGDALFEPRGMTATELTEGCYAARLKFNTASSIMKRLWEPRTNMKTLYRAGTYMLANITSRRAIVAKQGRKLGYDELVLSSEGRT